MVKTKSQWQRLASLGLVLASLAWASLAWINVWAAEQSDSAAAPTLPVETIRALIERARAGDAQGVLPELNKIYQDYPEQRGQLVFDLAVVATWAGENDLAWQVLKDIPVQVLPEYVLRPYGFALRDGKRWQASNEVFAELARRRGEDNEIKLIQALVSVDGEAFQRAEELLASAGPVDELSATNQTLWYLACGYAKERQRDFIAALDCYNRGLRVRPDDAELKRRRVVVASALGASEYAWRESLELPEKLAREEQAQVELDAAAMRIRWSNLANNQEKSEVVASALASHAEIEPQTAYQSRVRRYDQITALVTVFDMQGALGVAETLHDEGLKLKDLPSYVLNSLGQAYIYVEQPEQAIRCFELGLANLPDDAGDQLYFDLSVGLFYALSDAQRFEEVDELLAMLAEREIAWQRPTEKLWRQNYRYSDVEQISAMAMAYREKYGVALTQLQELLAIAPANDAFRLSKAAVNRWRGWHDQSAEELERVRLSEDDETAPLLVQQSHLYLDTQDFAKAERALNDITGLATRDKAVVDLDRRYQDYRRPELLIDIAAGRSDGTELGSDYLQVQTRYYTAPVAYRYRGYVYSSYRQAEFVEGDGRDHYVGAGVEYRVPHWTVTTGVHAGFEQADGVGAHATVDWRPDDYWRHGLSIASNSDQGPLRGARVGVEADSATYNGTYRWHEGRSLFWSLGAMDLSDGNAREFFGAGYRAQIANWPKHKLQGEVAVYTGRADRDDASYFSPEQDYDVSTTLQHEWRIWARYRESFTQRARVTLGYYDQDQFGGDQRWQAALEHEWRFDAGISVLYGVSFGRRPYDGVQEDQRAFYLSIRSLL